MVVNPFAVVDLSPQCEVRQRAWYEYGLLERIDGAVDLIAIFAAHIWRSPQEFEIPSLQDGRISLRWRATSGSAGIATLKESDQTLSLSLLASGLEPAGDMITLQAFQQHVVRELHDTGYEPSFELSGLTERPLMATIGLCAPSRPEDRAVFALADRCFAAAYFRRLGLA